MMSEKASCFWEVHALRIALFLLAPNTEGFYSVNRVRVMAAACVALSAQNTSDSPGHVSSASKW